MFKNKEEQFDFYWKEIFTGLAYNPIEFNTYRFDQTMSLPGKVNKLYDMFKVLAMNNQEVMDYLKEFVETFDFKLETTVKDVLEVWLNDGLLSEIVREAINDEVIEARTDEYGITHKNLKDRLTNGFYKTVNYVTARSFDGVSGSEKIQKALDYVEKLNENHSIVVVDTTFENENIWLLKNSIKIPNNTTLLLNGCYLKLDKNVNEVAITNKYNTGNHDINVIGVGKVVIDCNGLEQNFDTPGSTPYGVRFYNIKNFEISGIEIKTTKRQALVLEKMSDGLIDKIYFNLEGTVNQDGVHIIGPSNNIFVNHIRGVLGDDALVVNSRSNPAQGQGVGGDVTNIIFDNIIISGGYGDDGKSHVGLLRTAPGDRYKIDNIILSNAIGYNLKDAILRLGGNEVAPINNHNNISIHNVKGYQGTSGKISIAYMRTPVKNLNINEVFIETGNVPLFTNNRFDVEGLSISNVTRVMKEFIGEDKIRSVFELVASKISNVQINNVKDVIDDVTTNYIIDISSSTVNNIQINNVICKNVRSYIRAINGELNNVRLNNITINSDEYAYLDISSEMDIVINNYSVETGNGLSETPVRKNYQTGDTVQYRKDDTTKFKTFIKDHTNSWVLISNNLDENKGIRLSFELGSLSSMSSKTMEIVLSNSDNNIFYDIKPSFSLPDGVIYSYENFSKGKLKLTVFNGSDSTVTFVSDVWLAIHRKALFE